MKCKACNKTLSGGEQHIDKRSGELNDVCNECLAAAMNDSEFDCLRCAIDMASFSVADIKKEEDSDEHTNTKG